MRQRLRQKWRPPLSLVLGGSLAAVLILPVVGAVFATLLAPSIGGRWAAALVVLGAGLATLVLGYLLWRLILSPIRALGERASEISQGAPVSPIGRVGTPEVSEVAEVVLDMAEKLRAREMTVRSYADHVTHELRTPLTAIRGAAELLETPEADAETRALARTILDAEKRAERLLTAAAEIVAARRPSHSGATSLDAHIETWTSEHPTIEISIEGGDVILPLAATGLEMLSGHMIQNAKASSATRIAFRAEMRNGRPHLVIEDDGHGISDANAAQVFEPFFTTRRESGGTGMGLAVVRTMLNAEGYDITLSAPGKMGGARFVIGF